MEPGWVYSRKATSQADMLACTFGDCRGVFDWGIAYGIIPIAEPVLIGYCFYCLLKPFVERRKSACCAGAVYAAAMLLFYFLPGHPDGILVCCIGVFAAFLVLCVMDRRNYEQKAFLSVIFFSMRWLISGIAEILYDKLYAFAHVR